MEDKKEKKPLAPVVKKAPNVVEEKKFQDKVHDALIAEDIKDVVDWAVKKKVVPGFKELLVDMIRRMLLGGDSVTTAAKKSVKTAIGGVYHDYNEPYRVRRASDVVRESRLDSSSRGPSYRIGNIYVASRGEAQEINDEMAKRVEEYEEATVADLFSLCGITRSNHQDTKWGWTSATSFRYRPSGDEWLLNYDPPEYLG